MAANGSKSVAVTAYDTLKFSWAQISQSAVNNTTTISWTLQLVAGTAGEIISSAAKAWSVTVNGVQYSGSNSVAIGNNGSKVLASGQTTIAHGQDGTKSFNFAFSQQFSITFAGSSIGTVTGSGSGVLNTIPRATTPGLSKTNADMGETIVLYTAGASDSFRHDLAYSFAGGDFVSIASDVEDFVYWKIPLELASSIPNTTNGTVTIRCTTKNGSDTVGTKTVLLTAKVPTDVKPSITSVSATEAVASVVDKIGALVQSKSKAKVTITAAGVYGSTIKSYSSVFLGKTYTGESWTSDTIEQSGVVGIVTTVTDSRGRTESITTELSVLPYTAPQITAFTVARYNTSGLAAPDGTRAYITMAYSVASLNAKNTASAVIEYKRSIDTQWTRLDTRTALSFAGNLTPTTPSFSTDYQYDFRVTLTDTFGATATYSAVLPSGEVIFDIRADGKGIAFFKTSTKAGVEIAGELPGSAILLTTNADLDDLTTPGFYAIPTATISATIKNKPYTDTAQASIRVEQTGNGMIKQIMQKATKTDGAIFERGYDAYGWGAWSIVYAGAGKVLWTGNYVLNGSQSLTFSETVSQQQNGVVLVFSRYATSGEQNYAFSCHFIPKLLVSTAGGTAGVNMNLVMATTKFDYIAGKTITITNSGITGHADNIATGKADLSGISYYNDKFALRYVIGV